MKFIILFLVIFTHTSLLSQKEDHNWLSGYSLNNSVDTTDYGVSWLDFNFEPPSLKRISPEVSFDFTNTSISNTDGGLELFSNGVHIFGNDFNIIKNGDELQSSSIHSIVII